MTNELISEMVYLRPLGGADRERDLMPAWWGRAGHKLFLDAVGENDPALSGEIHDGQELRPFTVSNLLGARAGEPLDPGAVYSMRFTTLETRVAEVFVAARQPGGRLAARQVVELDHLPFEVVDAPDSAVENVWRQSASYHALGESGLRPEQAPPRSVTLHFASPVLFKRNGVICLLPEPALVFGSLLNRWNQFAPVQFPEELRRYAKECLYVNRLRVESERVEVTPEIVWSGVRGRVSFRSNHYDRYWMSLIQTLAAFSVFSGVGAKLSMGFGQCRQWIRKQQ